MSETRPHKRERFIFVSSICLLFGAYLFAVPYMQAALENATDSALVSVPFFLIWLIAALAFLHFSHLPKPRWKLHGITAAQWKASGFATLILLASSQLAVHAGVLEEPTALQSGDAPWWTFFLYLMFVPVQEFIARGILLGGFLYYFAGRAHPALFCILSAVIYSGLHLYLGLYVSFLVFIPGLVWCLLYLYTRSLFLVSLSHAICGLALIY